MQRIMGYVRVSTQEQAIHGLSVETQKANLEAWAETNHVRILEIYTDEGISARKPAGKRPALQALLNIIRSGQVDLVIFTKLDRWFRNVAEYYKVQEVLEAHHVSWKATQEDYETLTSAGRLKVNIMLAVAQDEADRTSERIKAVFERKRQKREPLTGSHPFGYTVEGNRFIKDPERERAVSDFFKKYLSSGCISYAQECVLRDDGVRISYNVADHMLRSRAYCGEYFGIDGMCPPYISQEEYQKIQGMRKRQVRKSSVNRVYIFSGILFCGECGLRMNGGTNQNGKSFTYHCQNRYFRRGDCPNNRCPGEKKIESYLVASIRTQMEECHSEALKAWERDKIRDYQAEKLAEKRKLQKLKELFINDLISIEEYKSDRAGIEEKLAELVRKEQNRNKPDFRVVEEMLRDSWESDYQEISREEKRAFWHILMREIRVYADKRIEYDLNL